MATIYDLFEVTSISAHTTYSEVNGNLLGVVDDVSSTALDDGEFDEGDSILIGGVSYTIDRIQEPSSSGRFTLDDGTDIPFNPRSESNLDVVFLTVSNGGDVRHFIIPNDSYGNMNVQSIRTGDIIDVAGNDAALVSTTNNQIQVVCFTRGTLIEGSDGDQIPVEDLQVDDPVMTLDNGIQHIRWIGMQSVRARTLQANMNLHPIHIPASALAPGLPTADLRVSPQHRILVRSKIAERMFQDKEVLVAAKQLIGLNGIYVDDSAMRVDYFHFLLDRHEVVFANGAACESLYLGQQAITTLPKSSQQEIFQLFPELTEFAGVPLGCRPMVPGRVARRLEMRHGKNAQPLMVERLMM